MGLRGRLERQIRAIVNEAAAHGGRVNVAGRANWVVVRNEGEGGATATASAEQIAPIVQVPPREPARDGD